MGTRPLSCSPTEDAASRMTYHDGQRTHVYGISMSYDGDYEFTRDDVKNYALSYLVCELILLSNDVPETYCSVSLPPHHSRETMSGTFGVFVRDLNID